MATFINENQKLHIFSKSPVLGPDENGNEAPFNYSVNKSGHTVTSAEVRSSDIPLFINVGSEEKINTYAKNPIHNDIVYWGSLKANTAVLRRWNGKNKIWEDYTQEFKNSTVLKNKDDVDVIKIHRKKAITSITADNNAGADSGNWAAFVKIDDNNRLTHFVAPTDKVQDGLPSLGYAPIVYINGEATDESTEEDGYIANTYAGIIQFNKKRNDLNLITVTAYEYTGEYLEKSLTNITSSELLETTWDEDNGIKVSLSGNVFNPSVEVSANFTDDVKTEVENNRTNTAVSVKGLVDYINDKEIYSTYNENGITVTLDGTIGEPVIEVDVNTVTNINDAIASNKGNNVVSAQAVKNYISSNNGVTNVSSGNKYLTITNPTSTPKITANIHDDILTWTESISNQYNGNWTAWQNDLKFKIAAADYVALSFDEHELREVNGCRIHVSEEDRELWNKGGNLQLSGDNFINPTENETKDGWNITLNTAGTIDDSNIDDTKTVPTVNAVKTYVDNLIDANIDKSSDIIWNLNDLLVSCINDTDENGEVWVKKLLRRSAETNSELLTIADYQKVYDVSDLGEAVTKWILEATEEGTPLSTQLAFKQNSYITNQLFRLFFYNLDYKLRKTYGSEDSISKKYMKKGLTFKYLSKVEESIADYSPNEGFGKPRFKYITVRYRGESRDPYDTREKEIDWEYKPTIENTVIAPRPGDIFQMAKAWDVIDSEEYDASNLKLSSNLYIDIDKKGNNAYDIGLNTDNIASEISTTSEKLTTEKSIIYYIEDTKTDGVITKEGAITKWHKDNEYFHMQKSVPDSLKHIPSDNRQVGKDCVGFIMKLPNLSKLKGISVIAATVDPIYGPSITMTWKNYYLKIVDYLTNEIIAISEDGQPEPVYSSSSNGYAVGVFYFNSDNQKYFDANRKYKVYFISKQTSDYASIKLAYANGNGHYMTNDGRFFGELSPSVILASGEEESAPSSFTVSNTVPCYGYSCNFFIDIVKSEEFNHLSNEITKLRDYLASMSTYISQLNKS